jgi:hypothetical protein
MRKPGSMTALEDFSRIRLSPTFFMRDFLYSEIANFYGVPNLPHDPDLAIAAGTHLCVELLEPIQRTFGRIAIRSGYRSAEVTAFGNKRGHGASVAYNSAYHLWDARDKHGRSGAAACIVIPWFADRYANGADWRSLAWWVHDHLPYAHMQFFPSSVPSIFSGASGIATGSKASSPHAALSRGPAWPTSPMITQNGTADFRHSRRSFRREGDVQRISPFSKGRIRTITPLPRPSSTRHNARRRRNRG